MITSKSIRIISLAGLIYMPYLASGMDAAQQFFNQQQAAAGDNQAPNQAQGGASDAFLHIATGLLDAVGKAGAKVVQTGMDAANAMAENSRRAAESRRAQLREIIENPLIGPDNPLYINAVQELDEIARQQKDVADNLNKLQAGGAQTIIDMGSAGVEVLKKAGIEAAERQTKAQLAEIEAQGKVRAAAVSMQVFFKNLTMPKVAGISVGLFGAYYGLKFGYQVLEDWYRIPDLADKTTIVPWYTKMRNWVTKNKVFNATLDDVVLEPELKTFFKEYVASTKNIIKNGGYLRHLLLPGPPGTGKTLSSMAMANELGLPAIYFSASNLRNFKVEDAITKLRNLFAYAENSPVPIVIIIDESEVVFASRDKALSEDTRMIMNQIMAKTGTEQCNFILVALTNRPQDFDDAFKSRFSETVYIGAPALAQRRQIVDMYVNKYIKNPAFKPKTTFLGSLRAKKNLKKVTFDDAIFTEQAITTIAQRLEGFTGRDISQLMMAVRDAAYATSEVRITQAMLNTVMARKIEKKRQEEHKDANPQPQENRKK